MVGWIENIDKWLDAQKQIDGWVDIRNDKNRWVVGWIGKKWMDGQMDRKKMDEKSRWIK